jgi:hypothetical protein
MDRTGKEMYVHVVRKIIRGTERNETCALASTMLKHRE